MAKHVVYTLSALAAFVITGASVAAFADSHVRMVRLSSVEGQVHMDRDTGAGLERAILNTPITQGVRVVTATDGLAEVEFENQSALRLTGDSEIKFSQLLMNDSGAKVNQIVVTKGLVYLGAASKGDDIYRLTVGSTSLLVHRDTELRLSVTPEQIQVAVFKGDVQLENQSQAVSAGKKETLTVDLQKGSTYNIAKSIEPVRFDTWNKERDDYGKTYGRNAGYGGPNRSYGLQDLNYYGNYFYASGYGYVWQPYGFANSMTGWDPYSNGAWTFSGGMGYGFTSSYPWGWLPYHYGSWAFINGAGWAWLPGNRYNGQWYASNFQNVPKVIKAPAGWTARTAPTITAANSAAPSVLVGKTGGSPVSIPGGRIPPIFGSVIPGRTVAATAATHGFVRPNSATTPARDSAVATSPRVQMSAHQGSAAHVFASPAAAAPSFNDDMLGRHRMGGPAVGIAPSAISSGGGHATPPAAHSSTAGGGVHK